MRCSNAEVLHNAVNGMFCRIQCFLFCTMRNTDLYRPSSHRMRCGTVLQNTVPTSGKSLAGYATGLPFIFGQMLVDKVRYAQTSEFGNQ